MSTTIGLLHAPKKPGTTALQNPLCLPFINATRSNRQDKYSQKQDAEKDPACRLLKNAQIQGARYPEE
jgi:hypothetical protein